MNDVLNRTGDFYEHQVVLVTGQLQCPLNPYRVIGERHGVVAVENIHTGEIDHYRCQDLRVYTGSTQSMWEALHNRAHDGRHYNHHVHGGIRRLIPLTPDDKRGFWRDDEVCCKGSTKKHIVIRHDCLNGTYTLQCGALPFTVDEEDVSAWVEPRPEPKFKPGDPVKVIRGSLMGLNLTVVEGHWVESKPDGHYGYTLRKPDGHSVNGVDECIIVVGHPTPYMMGDLITPVQGSPIVVRVTGQQGYNVSWTNKDCTIGGSYNTCQIRLATRQEVVDAGRREAPPTGVTVKQPEDAHKDIWEAIHMLHAAVAESEPRNFRAPERSKQLAQLANLIIKHM